MLAISEHRHMFVIVVVVDDAGGGVGVVVSRCSPPASRCKYENPCQQQPVLVWPIGALERLLKSVSQPERILVEIPHLPVPLLLTE